MHKNTTLATLGKSLAHVLFFSDQANANSTPEINPTIYKTLTLHFHNFGINNVISKQFFGSAAHGGDIHQKAKPPKSNGVSGISEEDHHRVSQLLIHNTVSKNSPGYTGPVQYCILQTLLSQGLLYKQRCPLTNLLIFFFIWVYGIAKPKQKMQNVMKQAILQMFRTL